MTEDQPSGVAIETIVAASGAVAGAILGPDAAVISSAMSPALAAALKYIYNWRWGRAERLVVTAASAAEVSADALIELLSLDSKRTALLAAAIDASTQTALDAKVNALAQTLASGALARDDAKIDGEFLVMRALAEVEAPHVRVLERLAKMYRWENYDGTLTEPGVKRHAEWELTNEFGEVVGALLLVMQSHALVRDVGQSVDELQRPLESRDWMITETGLLVLARLEDRANVAT